MAHNTCTNQSSGYRRSQCVFTPEAVAASLYGRQAAGSSTEAQRTQNPSNGARAVSSELTIPVRQPHVPTKKLTDADWQNVTKTYAVRSFPEEAELCWSCIPGAGYGVSAKTLIPVGTWIGPYEGKVIAIDDVTSRTDTTYLWEIYESGHLRRYIDGSDEETSSWMRFVRCARHKEEQNLYLFQYKGNIFYRAFRDIAEDEELLVWYDEKYNHHMGIPTGLQEVPVTIATGSTSTGFFEQRSQPRQANHEKDSVTSSPSKKPRMESNIPVVTQQQSVTCTPVPLALQHGVYSGIEFSEDFKKFLSRQPDYEETRRLQPPKEDEKLSGRRHHDTVTRQVSSSSTASQSSVGSPISPPTTFEECIEDGLEVKRLSVDEEPGSQKLSTKCRSIDDVSMWQCCQCHKTFTQRVLLQVHVCPNKPVNPYKCGHCAESFTNPTDLRVHVAKHSGEKPFKCGFCSRSFSGATTLNNHIRTHTGEKPFGCDKCGRTFSQPTHLARHMRVPGECSQRTDPATVEQRINIPLSP